MSDKYDVQPLSFHDGLDCDECSRNATVRITYYQTDAYGKEFAQACYYCNTCRPDK